MVALVVIVAVAVTRAMVVVMLVVTVEAAKVYGPLVDTVMNWNVWTKIMNVPVLVDVC